MKKRDDSIDAMKGIGMFLMVVGHSSISHTLDHFIFSFHMPLFFFISGYFFKIRPIKEEIINDTKHLLTPYAFTSTLLIFIAFIQSAFSNFTEPYFQDKLVNCLAGGQPLIEIPIYGKTLELGPLWFLLALFWARILASITLKLLKTTAFRIGATLILAFAGIAFVKANIFIPWFVTAGLCSFGFIYAGYLLRELEKNEHCKTLRILFAISMICWVYCILHSGLAMIACLFGAYYVIDLLGALGATICVAKATKFLYKENNPIWKFFTFLGKYSLVALCVHALECNNISWKSMLEFLPAKNIAYPIVVLTVRTLLIVGGIQIVLHSKFLRERIFKMR